MDQYTQTTPTRFLTKREVMARTSLRQEAIRVREIVFGTFPRRIYLSPRRVVWIESEVEKWIAEQAAQRQ